MIPLKANFKAGGAIHEISAEWLNTVATIFNDIQGNGCHIEKPAGQGYGWKIVIDGPGGSAAVFDRFLGVDQGSGILHVYIGAWTRRGFRKTLTPDLGKLYQTLAGIGSDDYVWVKIDGGSSYDPALTPDSISLDHGATEPDDTSTEGIYWILGKYTSGAWKQYWLGDIDDWVAVPDSEYHKTVISQSLEYGTTGWLQLFDFDSAADGSVATVYIADGVRTLTWLARGSPDPSDCGTGEASAGTSGIAYADHVHHIASADTATTALSTTNATYANYATTAGAAATLSTPGSLSYHDAFYDTAASSAHDTHNDGRYAPKGIDATGFSLTNTLTGELHPVTITDGSITAIQDYTP